MTPEYDSQRFEAMAKQLADAIIEQDGMQVQVAMLHNLIKNYETVIYNHEQDAQRRTKMVLDSLDGIMKKLNAFDIRCADHEDILALTKVHIAGETSRKQAWDTLGFKLIAGIILCIIASSVTFVFSTFNYEKKLMRQDQR